MALRLRILASITSAVDLWCFRHIGRRKPDLVIRRHGADYMARWHVIPKNFFFNIYYHVQMADDAGRHCHPYPSISWVLGGIMIEEINGQVFHRRPGEIVLRRAKTRHQLTLETGRYPDGTEFKVHSTRLFITGPRIRDWGFETDSGWVSHELVISRKDGISEMKQ